MPQIADLSEFTWSSPSVEYIQREITALTESEKQETQMMSHPAMLILYSHGVLGAQNVLTLVQKITLQRGIN